MKHVLRSRGICLTECVAVAAIFAITTAIIIPAAGSLNRGSMESDALGRIQRLSQAHSFYAADFDDRVITYTADDLTSFGQSMMAAVFSWSQWNESQENPIYPNPDWPESTFHPGLRLGWGGSLCDQDPDDQLYYHYYVHTGNSANGSFLNPICLLPQNGIVGIGAYQVTNGRTFRPYVTNRFYSRTFYSPIDYGAMDVLEGGQGVGANYSRAIFDCEVEFLNLPNPGFGDLPLASSFTISPALLFNPEILGAEQLIENPFTTESGLNTPNFSQCRYPYLKTEWLQEYASYTRSCDIPQGTVRGGLACGEVSHIKENSTPIPAGFMDGSTSLTTNRQFDRDEQRIRKNQRLLRPNNAIGLWHPSDQLNSIYKRPLLTRHLLTVDGILGRDLVDRTPAPSIK